MILKNCSLDVLQRIVKERMVVCFGAGKVIDEMYEFCAGQWQILEYCDSICDNDPTKTGSMRRVGNCEIPIINVEQLMKQEKTRLVVIITAGAYLEIIEQLEKIAWFEDVEVYVWNLAKRYWKEKKLIEQPLLKQNTERKKVIPSKIHYIWFGQEIPDELKRNIDTWHKYCPDYEYKLWNEKNYDVSKNAYMKTAYDNKRWAFVVDYMRLDIIYQEGGIYLDTDVEVIKNLDELRKEQAYISFETLEHVNAGSGFGAVKGHPMIKAMRDEYDNIEFCEENQNIASPVWQTQTLQRYGLKCDGSHQMINGLTVFPFSVLCCKSLASDRIYTTNNSYSIHHFAGSWKEDKVMSETKRLFLSSLQNEYV